LDSNFQNKNIMKQNLSLLIISSLALLASCTKVLEQDPQESLDAADAFSTRAGVEAGLTGIYDGLQAGDHNGIGVWIYADLYADNLTHTGTFPTFAQMANKQLLADNVNITNMWNVIYNSINRANNVIDAAPKINDPAFNSNAAVAEARCLRAFCYFDILRFFGGTPAGYNQAGGLGLPIFTAPTLAPADAAPKARSTEAEVYTQILGDLDFAIANLPTTAANGRVTKNAATALKARVQLYREQWTDAEAQATAIISQFETQANGGLVSGANYANLWLSKNVKPESIWELQYFSDDRNFGAFYYYTGATGGRNEITSSTSLNTAHETGDLRKPVNVTVAAAGIPANKTRKFSRPSGDDNIILIRLAELYLIRAEARARKASADIAGAQSDLNVIRTRAGLPATTAATTADLITAIKRERRIELAHEGHRYFDLRRYNSVSEVGITESFRTLWPIPQRETLTSGGVVTQNPGY
jgi:starch-binding outer membrane protein, SusD/RagB family